MESLNPYAAPEGHAAPVQSFSESFNSLDDKALKKLYYRSCNVTGIGALTALGTLIMGIVLLVPENSGQFDKTVIGAILALYAVTVIGVFMRSAWGRVLGIIASAIFLINIPIGTIIGLMGLFAFIGAPQLFGENRVKHKDLKAEFKARKARGFA